MSAKPKLITEIVLPSFQIESNANFVCYNETIKSKSNCVRCAKKSKVLQNFRGIKSK